MAGSGLFGVEMPGSGLFEFGIPVPGDSTVGAEISGIPIGPEEAIGSGEKSLLVPKSGLPIVSALLLGASALLVSSIDKRRSESVSLISTLLVVTWECAGFTQSLLLHLIVTSPVPLLT